MPEISNCIVLIGADLVPQRCRRFAWDLDTITAIDAAEPVTRLEEGALVIVPGLTNAHTHMGDSAFPDGATGLTLEQGFFRPNGFKYREIEKLGQEQHRTHLDAHLRYMARTGTVRHIDFREQGPYGSELLKASAAATGIDSIALGQFSGVPFDTKRLVENQAALPPAHRQELAAILAAADGFSESTMNDLTDAAWREIREVTTRLGKWRAIHCLENAGYRDESLRLTGRGDLERAIELLDPLFIVHLTVARPDEIALLVRSGKCGVLNPRANANLGLPLPPIAALLNAGARLLLGTDNGMLNSPSMLAELDFTYKVAKSQFGDAVLPDPAAILKMATSHIHPVLRGDRYGRLEVGLPADFFVANFHAPHLRSTRNILASLLTRVTPDEVLGTFRHGRPLWQNPVWNA